MRPLFQTTAILVLLFPVRLSLSAESKPDSDWYLAAAGTCEVSDPRSMLQMGKLLGVEMQARDVKENGKVVATTIHAADGSSATYYRGKARCQAALRRESKDVDRYN